jgi:hypothetical protein
VGARKKKRSTTPFEEKAELPPAQNPDDAFYENEPLLPPVPPLMPQLASNPLQPYTTFSTPVMAYAPYASTMSTPMQVAMPPTYAMPSTAPYTSTFATYAPSYPMTAAPSGGIV